MDKTNGKMRYEAPSISMRKLESEGEITMTVGSAVVYEACNRPVEIEKQGSWNDDNPFEIEGWD